jgi:Phosphatidylethanolamine-binding protein
MSASPRKPRTDRLDVLAAVASTPLPAPAPAPVPASDDRIAWAEPVDAPVVEVTGETFDWGVPATATRSRAGSGDRAVSDEVGGDTRGVGEQFVRSAPVSFSSDTRINPIAAASQETSLQFLEDDITCGSAYTIATHGSSGSNASGTRRERARQRAVVGDYDDGYDEDEDDDDNDEEDERVPAADDDRLDDRSFLSDGLILRLESPASGGPSPATSGRRARHQPTSTGGRYNSPSPPALASPQIEALPPALRLPPPVDERTSLLSHAPAASADGLTVGASHRGSYGGSNTVFLSPEGGGAGRDGLPFHHHSFFDPIDDDVGVEDYDDGNIDYDDTTGSVENDFMGSRGSSFVDMEEEGRKAAFIIGSFSLAVFFVVVAVVISGLTSLLGTNPADIFQVESDWTPGGVIPLKYGCLADGGPTAAVSIPLRFNHIPPRTTSLVVLVHNPGAIKMHGEDPVHWLVTGISVKEGKICRPTSGMRLGLEQNRTPVSIAAPEKTTLSESECFDESLTKWTIPQNASTQPQLLPAGAVQRPNTKNEDGSYDGLCRGGYGGDDTRSLYTVYVFAVDADPVLHSLRDARQIMNRFSAVPTARLAGYYGGDIKSDSDRAGSDKDSNSPTMGTGGWLSGLSPLNGMGGLVDSNQVASIGKPKNQLLL